MKTMFNWVVSIEVYIGFLYLRLYFDVGNIKMLVEHDLIRRLDMGLFCHLG